MLRIKILLSLFVNSLFVSFAFLFAAFGLHSILKEKLIIFFKKHRALPKAHLAEAALARFSLTEKIIFWLCALVLFASTATCLWQVNQTFMVEIPLHGGTLTEGIVGLPRFINPILAISDADRDLTALVYSGLLKATAEGALVPDLAESYSVSTDGLTYTFILKPEITFQDKTPITADDVVFTVEKAEDPSLKSPKRPNWEGVQVEKVSEREVKFTLKQPYSPFLENMTLGVLPKHLWNTIDAEEFPFSQLNVEPVGSGPFKLKSVERNASGIPVNYRLEAFDAYSAGEPFIKNIITRFYQNNKDLITAYGNGTIEAMAGISPQQASVIQVSGGEVLRAPLPRIFAVFFNQNHAPILANKEVRLALDTAIDKEAIVESVLDGEGIAIDSPIPPRLLPKAPATKNSPILNDEERIQAAKKILENAKWKLNPDTKVYEKVNKKQVTELAFFISTSNAPELKAAAELLKTVWGKIGVRVDVKVFEIGELNQNVIRTRKYDALLFGEIIGRDLDLFAFWHSSQRNDPGLNVALYTNAKVDKLLESARATADQNARIEKYRSVEQEIQNDIPAIFLYSPDFLYVVPKSLQGSNLNHITVPAERFLSIEKWYVETEKVWKIFAPKQ